MGIKRLYWDSDCVKRRQYQITSIPCQHKLTLCIWDKDTDEILKGVRIINKKWHQKEEK